MTGARRICLADRRSAAPACAPRQSQVRRRHRPPRGTRRAGTRAWDRRPGAGPGHGGSRALIEEALDHGADALGMAGGDGSDGGRRGGRRRRGASPSFACRRGRATTSPATCVSTPATRSLLSKRSARESRAGSTWARWTAAPFVNCVSLGVYAEAVAQPGYRDAKLQTLLETARAVLGPSGQPPNLHLVDGQGGEHEDPAMVLVSNNPYALGRPSRRGGRRTLDSGRLGIIVIDAPDDRGRPPAPGHAGFAWTAAALRIRAARAVHAGVDGEAAELTPSLEFSIRPRALRVRIPRAAAVDRGHRDRR